MEHELILIAHGKHRRVYQHPDNDLWVIKYPMEPHNVTHNKYEGLIWKFAQEFGYEQFFVPVVNYSPTGQWLIMEKAVRLGHNERRPSPQSWMVDTKLSNWGRYNGHIRLLDYGQTGTYNRLKDHHFKHHKKRAKVSQ